MSTKSSLAHGPNFHLYAEMFDDNNVYLELENVHFEAAHNRVVVPIPVQVWEFIRRYPGISFEYADKSDEELRQYVKCEVDERLKRYREENEKGKAIAALFGALMFGSIDKPREEQIVAGITYLSKRRHHQKQIQRDIAELGRFNK